MTTTGENNGADATAAQVEARFAMIEGRIGQPLTKQQADEVKQRIGRSIELGAALRAYPLTNADEPEIAFAPYRGVAR